MYWGDPYVFDDTDPKVARYMAVAMENYLFTKTCNGEWVMEQRSKVSGSPGCCK